MKLFVLMFGHQSIPVLFYIELSLLLGFAQNLDSDFIKKIILSFFCENGHIHLD